MTALYETIIIIPRYMNDGRISTLESRKKFRKFLKERFGGYTAVSGKGADPYCKRKDEDIEIFTVANDNTTLSRSLLYGYAWGLCKKLDQKGIYVRWPNGRVQFVGDPADTIKSPTDTPRWPIDPNSPSDETRSETVRREHGARVEYRNLKNGMKT